MSQNKIHFLRFLLFDKKHVGFWAVLKVANFRGTGDDEDMILSHINGHEARNKPKELFTELEGLVAIIAQPTSASLRPSPKVATPQAMSTQELLVGLQSATQTSTASARSPTPSTPDSQGSKASWPTISGKAPKQHNQPQAKPQQREEDSDSESSTKCTSSEEEESDEVEEIQSVQPNLKKRKTPSGKPKTLVQSTLLGGGKSRVTVYPNRTVEESDEATTIRFSSGNFSQAQLNELVEKKFLEMQNEEADAKASTKKGAKKGGKTKLPVPKAQFFKGKPSSAASTEQKGTPLFMNGPDIFSCSNTC